jgi:predicted DNA-binding ArsR family transcriptional regulator
MAIQITNNIATLDIDFDGNGDQYSIHKPNITLEKSGDTVVIVDSGRVPAKEYKILYTDVTPKYDSADDLYADILGYINVTSLTQINDKTPSVNPKIEETPQELLRQIHSGIDTLIQQQMLTNNLLKLILS